MLSQVIQDGCCLALCTSPAQPVPASPISTDVTDLLTDLLQVPAVIFLIKGQLGVSQPFAGFPGN